MRPVRFRVNRTQVVSDAVRRAHAVCVTIAVLQPDLGTPDLVPRDINNKALRKDRVRLCQKRVAARKFLPRERRTAEAVPGATSEKVELAGVFSLDFHGFVVVGVERFADRLDEVGAFIGGRIDAH